MRPISHMLIRQTYSSGEYIYKLNFWSTEWLQFFYFIFEFLHITLIWNFVVIYETSGLYLHYDDIRKTKKMFFEVSASFEKNTYLYLYEWKDLKVDRRL